MFGSSSRNEGGGAGGTDPVPPAAEGAGVDEALDEKLVADEFIDVSAGVEAPPMDEPADIDGAPDDPAFAAPVADLGWRS